MRTSPEPVEGISPEENQRSSRSFSPKIWVRVAGNCGNYFQNWKNQVKFFPAAMRSIDRKKGGLFFELNLLLAPPPLPLHRRSLFLSRPAEPLQLLFSHQRTVRIDWM